MARAAWEVGTAEVGKAASVVEAVGSLETPLAHLVGAMAVGVLEGLAGSCKEETIVEVRED